MSELKPCPFCGHNDNTVTGYKSFWVECNNCGVETPIFDTKEEAEQLWNRRANNGKD